MKIQTIKIDEILNNYSVRKSNFQNDMSYKIDNENWNKQNCLMNLANVNQKHDIYLNIDHSYIYKHEDFESNVSFIQWWLDYIKENICSNYNAVITESYDDYSIILIKKQPNLNNFVGFTNYELIRYLVGQRYNCVIPQLVYELIKNKRKYFKNDLEIFYYSIYLFTIYSFNVDGSIMCPNYTWQYSAGLYILNDKTNRIQNLYIPLYSKPDNDYKTASTNFSHLANKMSKKLLDNHDKYYKITNFINAEGYKLYAQDSLALTKYRNEKQNQISNFIFNNIQKSSFNDIVIFEKSLVDYDRICNLKFVDKLSKLFNIKIEKNEKSKA